MRFNAAKLLLDPYGKAVSGDLVVDDAIFDYVRGDPTVEERPRLGARTSRAAWSSTTSSSGAPTPRRAAAGATPSSTRCTSRA